MGLVLAIGRRDVGRGTTTLHARNGALLGEFTLSAPLDAALVDAARVYHGVTPSCRSTRANPPGATCWW